MCLLFITLFNNSSIISNHLVSLTLIQYCMWHLISNQTEFQLASEHDTLLRLGVFQCFYLRWTVSRKDDMLIVHQFLIARIITTGRLAWLLFSISWASRPRKLLSIDGQIIQSKLIMVLNMWKLKKDRDSTEDEVSLENSRALNVIYIGVDKNIMLSYIAPIVKTNLSLKKKW